MKRAALLTALLLLTAIAALALRIPQLNRRPMHADEAVHTVKCTELWQTGRYAYDASEYHGPTLYYFTLPSVWLSGVKDFARTQAATYRIVPVIFGVGLVLLLVLVADGLGRGAALAAGVLTAASPAMVFYSRYYVQETLLVFFTFLAIAAGWRYAQSRRIGWALLAGAAVGSMHATKETCVIALASMAVALAVTVLWGRAEGHAARPSSLAAWRRALLAGGVAAVLVSVVCFSAVFTNSQGLWHSIQAYATYATRAGGGGVHDHPWYYYLQLLLYNREGAGPLWSEGLIVALGIVGLLAGLRCRSPGDTKPGLVRFLALYTVVMTTVYSVIPYKTPWCLLGFLHGVILLAGVGAATIIRMASAVSVRAIVALLLLVGVGHLGRQAWLANTRYCADARNPYVYGATVPDVDNLAAYVAKLAEVQPDGRRMLIKVFADNPWPLSWYLREFQRVGYWGAVPDNPDAPVIIVSQELRPALDRKLREQYWTDGHYGLRRDAVMSVYVEKSLRTAFEQHARLATQPGTPPRRP